MSQPLQHPSSFRDPAGFIFTHANTVYRQINQVGKVDFDHFIASGLYDALVAEGLLVAHTDVPRTKQFGENTRRYKVIKPQPIPFISYPYEWSFSQLKDAALLTLHIQKLAFKHGMVLKDASTFNIQFIGKKPVFIDTLSFAVHTPGRPWEAYRQFCEHFLAPLAVARYTSYGSLKILQSHLEGLPLALACSLLPKRARFSKGLLGHLFLHSASQKKYENVGAQKTAVPKRAMSSFAFEGLVSSLENTIKALRPPHQQTEWGDYYSFTNYTDAAFKQKQKLVKQFLANITPAAKTVWDMGANNGEFSSIAARSGAYTVAFDIDPVAVGRNYHHKDTETIATLLPLVQDCTNPSPALGWMNTERDSLIARGPADVVMALALIHHLAIARNLPFDHIADFFAAIGHSVIIEFVPKEDSKVQVMLASRTDIFPHYDLEHFERAFQRHFKLVKKESIKGTKRTLLLYKRIGK